MNPEYTLISHKLCPYVQRVAIVLMEKGCEYERIDIDLANKPKWFMDLSPLGKTPVLLVDGKPLFESAVICEFLDETVTPKLHPPIPFTRAQHRGWIEFASSTLNVIAAFYNAVDELTLQVRAEELRQKFLQVEKVLSVGPYFQGSSFTVVDAAFAPAFRYFDILEEIIEIDFFSATPKVKFWRASLRERKSVKDAVNTDYPHVLKEFFEMRGSALSSRLFAGR